MHSVSLVDYVTMQNEVTITIIGIRMGIIKVPDFEFDDDMKCFAAGLVRAFCNKQGHAEHRMTTAPTKWPRLKKCDCSNYDCGNARGDDCGDRFYVRYNCHCHCIRRSHD